MIDWVLDHLIQPVVTFGFITTWLCVCTIAPMAAVGYLVILGIRMVCGCS